MRFLCIFLRFYAILCQKLQNFPQLFAKSCERPCKNFVLVFDFVAVSQNSPAKSRYAPIRSARRGAAAAGRGTERTPSRTPARMARRREERCAATLDGAALVASEWHGGARYDAPQPWLLTALVAYAYCPCCVRMARRREVRCAATLAAYVPLTCD